MEEDNCPKDILHIFAENVPVRAHSESIIAKLDAPITLIEAIDQVPERQQLTPEEVWSLKRRKLSDTGNLMYTLQIKIGAKVMLTAIINKSDRLTIGQIGVVWSFQVHRGNVMKVYINFNDKKTGLKSIAKDNLLRTNWWVPVEKSEALFYIRRNRDIIPFTSKCKVQTCRKKSLVLR